MSDEAPEVLDEAPTGTQYTLTLSPEENEAIARAQEREPFKTLEVSKRKIIRLAVLAFGDDSKSDSTLLFELKRAIFESEERIKVAISNKKGKEVVVVAPAEPQPRKNARLTDEDKDERGMQICDVLGGTVVGRSCAYKKYEVTPTGRAINFDITTPLSSLTEADVAKQYDPSREQWEAAVANES